MPGANQKITVLRAWVEKADDDFKMANHAFSMGANCPFASICFHVQQCVEKYVKALLVFHEIDFPRIHDIGRLIQLLPKRVVLPIDVPTQELLTGYAVAARYPGADEPVSRVEARRALSVMRKVRKAARTYFPGSALRQNNRL